MAVSTQIVSKAHPVKNLTPSTPTAPPFFKLAWAPWRALYPETILSADALEETLDGGQAFRWTRLVQDQWQGIWNGFVVQIRLDAKDRLEWRCPATMLGEVKHAIGKYFSTNLDFEKITDNLPWRSDEKIAEALEHFRGLRILKQPIGETLLGFLCSSSKQIVQIKQILQILAERFGHSIGGGQYSLPDWLTLAEIPEEDLRECKMGYRAKYVCGVAKFLSEHPHWLDEVEKFPYALAKKRLMTLPGVGAKIADCVLLFGAGKLESFPVDVWVAKSMARLYGLQDWKPPQIAHFGQVHFGKHAGYAQQLLFAFERKQKELQSMEQVL